MAAENLHASHQYNLRNSTAINLQRFSTYLKPKHYALRPTALRALRRLESSPQN